MSTPAKDLILSYMDSSIMGYQNEIDALQEQITLLEEKKTKVEDARTQLLTWS